MMVGKGVLQGDCLSPIILSMGYSYSKTLLPHQWFQFGNVLAITAPIEKDNHILLNVFTKCCNWAGLIISREKCSTFGFKKNGNSSIHLKVNNEVTAPIRLNALKERDNAVDVMLEIFNETGENISSAHETLKALAGVDLDDEFIRPRQNVMINRSAGSEGA